MRQQNHALRASPDREPGLRELGKMERLRRIKEAAKAVFAEQGYDEATTREIARRASVSIGTIFVYAQDKRDLLFLVLNEELDPIAAKARNAVPERAATLDRLCELVRPTYRYFGANLTFGRYAMREMAFYEPDSKDFGEQCARYRKRMRRLEESMAELVREGRERGELVFEETDAAVGNLVYLIYLAEIRNWVNADAPVAARGTDKFRSTLAILFDGLRSRRGGSENKPKLRRRPRK